MDESLTVRLLHFILFLLFVRTCTHHCYNLMYFTRVILKLICILLAFWITTKHSESLSWVYCLLTILGRVQTLASREHTDRTAARRFIVAVMEKH